MGEVVFGMNASLDLFVDHEALTTDAVLFRHWLQVLRSASAALYGRRIYQLMQYWDGSDPAWDADAQEFAAVWQAQRKYVASRGQPAMGPGAELIQGDVAGFLRALKAELPGTITVSGTDLAASLSAARLIDTYRLYLHPVVLGQGTAFFRSTDLPKLRLVETLQINADVVRLSYAAVHSG